MDPLWTWQVCHTTHCMRLYSPILNGFAPGLSRQVPVSCAKRTTTAVFESTLLCPELGLRGRVDLALRRDSASNRPSVSRIVELKTAKYKEEWPDPEFQVRGYYAILASQQRLAADFDAVVLYTGGAVVEARRVSCGPSDVAHVVLNRNRAVIALLLGHAPPAGGNRCRRSSGAC